MAKKTAGDAMGFYSAMSAPLDLWEQSVDQSVEMASSVTSGDAGSMSLFGLDPQTLTANWADLNKRAIKFARTSMQEGEATLQAVQNAKSPMEALEVQANYAQVTMERYMTEAMNASQTIASAFGTMKLPFTDGQNAFAGFWQK